MNNKKLSKSEIYKIRYHVYRQAGYSAAEARKLRVEKWISRTAVKKMVKYLLESRLLKKLSLENS